MLIIDECHSLSKAAWQALLKVVEEPPKHAYFCFCTTDATKVPKTIVTRCCSYALQPLRSRELEQRLIDIARVEGLEADEDSIAEIVKKAQGSARLGISLLSQAAGLDYEDVKELSVDGMGDDITDAAYQVARAMIDKRASSRSVGAALAACFSTENPTPVLPDSLRYMLIGYYNSVMMKNPADGFCIDVIEALSSLPPLPGNMTGQAMVSARILSLYLS
jgi:DNA polymerase III gamma/tau subunit